MVKNISKTVLFFMFLIIIGCKNNNKEDLFVLTDKALKTVENNKDCLNIFKNGFGVDSLNVKEYHYVEALLGRFLNLNKGKDYKSITFLKLDESGEISHSTTLSIGKLNNGDFEIIKFWTKNDEIKQEKKLLRDFSMNELYKKLGKEVTNNLNRFNRSLMTIEFKSNENCDCKLYNLSFSEVNSIEDMSIFD